MKLTLPAVILLLLSATSLLAWQTYVPPPPPRIPEALSKEAVERGKTLFEESRWAGEKVDIYNYLGPIACASCHDKPHPLTGEKLAEKFKDLPLLINREIVKNSKGKELPPQDPAMEALVQYLASRYNLREYKLAK